MAFRNAPMSAAAPEAVDRDTLFTPEIRAEIETWCAKYPSEWRRSAVIPALHILQDATWSPGRSDVTPSPTASTTPAPSWPSTVGA